MLPKLTLRFGVAAVSLSALSGFVLQEGADGRGAGAEGGALLPALPRQDGHPHLRRLPPAHRGPRGQRSGQAVARRGEPF